MTFWGLSISMPMSGVQKCKIVRSYALPNEIINCSLCRGYVVVVVGGESEVIDVFKLSFVALETAL